MSAANITLSVEPSQHGSVTCLAMAPSATSAQGHLQISLLVQFANHESSPVHVSTMTLSFPGTGLPSKAYSVALDIAAGGVATWAGDTKDDLVIPQPLPAQMTISLAVDGFDTATATTLPLALHVSPTPQGSFRFWGDPAELRPGEYWHGIGASHGAGVAATQIFAYDVVVQAFDGNAWNPLLPGTDSTHNESHRIWGKSLHAVADGVVVAFRNDFPTNAVAGKVDPAITQMFNTVGDGNGNFFCIQTADETVLYAHMQPGSLNPALLTLGAKVTQGMFLGRAGNAGSSSGPHLHIHSNQSQLSSPFWVGAPRPFPMHGGQVLGASRLQAQLGFGPWVALNGRGFPAESALVWPVDNSWESLGGILTSGPAVASWGKGRLDVFVRATDNSLYHLFWNGSHWSAWQGLGGSITSDPAAVSWGDNRVDVFARGTDNSLQHIYWNGKHWSAWESLGGTLTSGPAAASRGHNRLDVFVRATDNSLYQKLWDGSHWSNWQALGGQLFSDPDAVAWNSDRLDVFARGADNTLRHFYWDGNWHP